MSDAPSSQVLIIAALKLIKLSIYSSLQDRDECLEIADLCGDQQKCLNTPGEMNTENLSI